MMLDKIILQLQLQYIHRMIEIKFSLQGFTKTGPRQEQRGLKQLIYSLFFNISGVTLVNGKIYIIGGFLDQEMMDRATSSVDSYNIETGDWAKVSNWKKKLYFANN